MTRDGFHLEIGHEIIWIDVGLAQGASQRSYGQLIVEWNDAPYGPFRQVFPEDHVTASLPDLRKPQSLECANGLAARDSS